MSNKFIKTLTQSDSNIKEKRALTLGTSVKIAQETIVNNLKRELNSLNHQMDKLVDLSPDYSFSLKPGGEDFDAENWASELQRIKLEIKIKEMELETAQETLEEWFTDDIDEQ